MLRIAFYGKGGIGKSTVAAHLSAAFARTGKRVLHIGCDPKADSTRCLTSGRIPTVLETLGRSEELLAREQLVFPGAFGVSCVEAGGPQAGAGCAGLGITAMADELNRLGILEEPWDVVVYDVLGDVVCGGFAVPMRKHFVDRVYLITSADFMALYAANNIMRGVARYSGAAPLLGGLIQNRSHGAGEDALVRSFAEQSGTRVVGILPEDRQLRRADYLHTTVHHLEPDRGGGHALSGTGPAALGYPAHQPPATGGRGTGGILPPGSRTGGGGACVTPAVWKSIRRRGAGSTL